MVTDDKSLPCPHCLHQHDLSDADVYQHVVSYWGENLHKFICSSCDEDFVVRETVIRKYETAKSETEMERKL